MTIYVTLVLSKTLYVDHFMTLSATEKKPYNQKRIILTLLFLLGKEG